MPTQTLRRTALAVSLLLPLLAGPAFAAGPSSRIAAVNTAQTAAIPGSVHPMARPEFDRGVAPDAMPLSGLAIHFQRSAAQQTSLEALIAAQNDPSSPLFHKWLTPEQFAASYGMSSQDIAKTTAWLESQGFSVVKVADSGNAILFTGTAGQVRHAMGTEIHHYLVNGITHYANASAVTLPAALAGVVNGVSGLDDFKPEPKSIRGQALATGSSTGGVTSLFTSGISGTHYLQPGDFSTIYDTKPLLNGGFTGAGITIGIIGQTDIVLSDITAFRAAASPALPVNNPTVLLIPGSGDPGISYNDLPEADLDLEWSGGVAPNANIVFLNSTNAFDSALYAIENRVTVNSSSILIPILSSSYGLCEAEWSAGDIATLEAAFQQAAAQGQTLIAASGDDGAADCDEGTETTPVTVSTLGLAVDYPASSAYVTGIGGTEFNEGTAFGGTTYWSSNGSSDVISSALSYIPEMAWNDTPNAELDDELAGGGGGASIKFSKPSWQAGVPGIPSDGKRDVPDISLNASPVHDGYLVCTQVQLVSTGAYAGSCGNGFRIADGSATDNADLTPYGGTSLGAPSFAGVLALMEQKLGGSPQGLVNPALYGMASNATTYASAFHDVTVGNNEMPCSGGNGCVNGLVGYAAGTGYDQATGLGSIDANNLATAFASYIVTNGGKMGTSVALTYAPTALVIGQPVLFTATVTQNSGSAVPTGSITFSVDGTAIGGAVTLIAGTASTTYSFPSGGTHTVVASYSGDSADYASLSPTLSLTNFSNAAGSALTTTVLTSSSGSTSLYSSASPSYTATVTSTASGTLGGTTVTFTVGTGAGAVSTKVPAPPSCSTTQCIFVLNPTSVTDVYGYSAGTVTVNAHYDGNTNYQQSSSNQLSIAVANPSFTIAVPAMTVSASPLATPATATATITSSGGFNDPINLTLTSSNFPGCGEVSPSTVTPPANGTVTATVTLANCALGSGSSVGGSLRSGIAANGFGAGNTWLAGGLLALLCAAGCFRRRRLPRLAAMAAVVLLGGLMLGMAGCGGGGSSTLSNNLASGTYQVTITGTDALPGSLVPAVSTTFNVVVH